MRISVLKWTIIVGRYAKSVLLIGISAILLMTGCYIFTVQSVAADAITVVEGNNGAGVDTGTGAAGAAALGDANDGSGAAAADGAGEGQSGTQPQTGGQAGEYGAAAGEPGAGTDGDDSNKVYIYVTGAVVKPGVYALEKSSMVVDAVEMAGGLTAEADEENINMVYKLESNAMLNIKRKTVEVPAQSAADDGEADSGDELYGSGVTITSDYDGQLIEMESDDGSTGGENGSESRMNINTASKELLATLPGIGSATANNIITYREKNGGFSKIEDIMKVSGIKQAKFDAIKDLIGVK